MMMSYLNFVKHVFLLENYYYLDTLVKIFNNM